MSALVAVIVLAPFLASEFTKIAHQNRAFEHRAKAAELREKTLWLVRR